MDKLNGLLFRSEQACAAFDFSEAHLRRLVQWGALVPSGGRGRGKTRLLSFGDIAHLGTIAALNRAGISLQMAHTISAFLPAEPSRSVFQPDVVEGTENFDDLFGAAQPKVWQFPLVTLRIFDNRLVVWHTYVDRYALGELTEQGFRLLVNIKETASPFAFEAEPQSLLLHPAGPDTTGTRDDLVETYNSATDERIIHIDRVLVFGFRKLLGLS